MKMILNLSSLVQNPLALFFNNQIPIGILNSSKAGVGKLGPRSQVWPNACLYNHLLAHRHPHSLACCLWLFGHYNGRVGESQQTPCDSKSLKYLQFEPLQEKFAYPCSPQSFSLETGYMVGASAWLSRLSVPPLTLAQIMIPGS